MVEARHCLYLADGCLGFFVCFSEKSLMEKAIPCDAAAFILVRFCPSLLFNGRTPRNGVLDNAIRDFFIWNPCSERACADGSYFKLAVIVVCEVIHICCFFGKWSRYSVFHIFKMDLILIDGWIVRPPVLTADRWRKLAGLSCCFQECREQGA